VNGESYAPTAADRKILRQLADHRQLASAAVTNASADLLGLAIANFLTVLSVPTVVLGGGVTEALGKPWLHRIQEAVEQHVFPSSLRKCEVHLSELGDDAGLLGAAMLARETASA
jgi:glucokinase